MRWTRIPTYIAGERRDDDWIVLRDGWSVGCVHLTARSYGGPDWWAWATWTFPGRHGHVDTFEEALELVRSNATEVHTASVQRMR